MEKIANLQMPGRISAGTKSRSVQNTGFDDGFLKMLQQKQEVSDSKEQPKTDESEKPVKDMASGTKEEAEKAPEEAPMPEDDVQQAAMEQVAMNLAAQSMVVTPGWQEQPVQMEAVAEAVVAVGELPVEWMAEKTDAVMPGMVQTDSTGEEKMPVAMAEPAVQQPVVQETEAKENRQEMPVDSGEASKETVYTGPENTKKSQEPLSGVKEEMPQSEGSETEVSYGVVHQTQMSGKSELPAAERTEGIVMKSTVEELPQELSKAMSSGQTTGSQTLTVELEPVSLGKLTIRVEYEAGRTSVSILASNPKTLELLNEKASEIAAILKERTGEETVIYTQQPEPQQQDQYEGHQGSRRGQEEQKQHGEEERHETESFAQQLRLGLV